MSKVFFSDLEIPKPHINLNINCLSNGAMIGRMIEGIESILQVEKPDWVIVYGDTNSTIAGSLAAKILHNKVIHIEAGLRSFNSNMPEEINRIITDRISDVLFCPSNNAVNNLKNEGFDKFKCIIKNVGDVLYDVMKKYQPKAKNPLKFLPAKFIVLTLHRVENTGNKNRINDIFEALHQIAEHDTIIFPIHPRMKKIIQNLSLHPNVHFIAPVSYFEMLYLLKHCHLVMTDSGGLQKEAYYFNKPVIILRDETEWIELIEKGYNKLTGTNTTKIIKAYNYLIKNSTNFEKNIYGDGKAAESIVTMLMKIN